MRLPTTDLTLDRFLMKDRADEKGDESENVKGQSQILLSYQKTLPKAQRTRGLSSAYQSNLNGHIKFRHKS